ncbi:MAG: hypothetical protein U5L06_06275 [Rhodovibrio sp.]|nr:hypothetical protein [Rhodovibrio sp.]
MSDPDRSTAPRASGTALPGREIRRFDGHDDEVTSVAFAPDGATCLTGSGDRTARFWDCATGEPIRALIPLPDSWAVLGPDGRMLAHGPNLLALRPCRRTRHGPHPGPGQRHPPPPRSLTRGLLLATAPPPPSTADQRHARRQHHGGDHRAS